MWDKGKGMLLTETHLPHCTQRSGADTVALVPSQDRRDASQVALVVAPEW